MRRYPQFAVGAAAAASILAGGCAAGGDGESGTDTPPAPTNPTGTSAPPTSSSPAPGDVGVSPGGVTTAVGAPAESTEDDYFQACIAARRWMEQQGGDLGTQIEPYLAMVQREQSAGPATLGAPWSQLSPGQQSAVIVAVEAAAKKMCG